MVPKPKVKSTDGPNMNSLRPKAWLKIIVLELFGSLTFLVDINSTTIWSAKGNYCHWKLTLTDCCWHVLVDIDDLSGRNDNVWVWVAIKSSSFLVSFKRIIENLGHSYKVNFQHKLTLPLLNWLLKNLHTMRLL